MRDRTPALNGPGKEPGAWRAPWLDPHQILEAPRALSARLAAFGSDEHTVLLVLAALIGIAAGLTVTVVFRLIDLAQRVVLSGGVRLPVADVILIPVFVAVGLMAARGLVRWLARGSTGENVPDVMYRVTVRGGVVPGLPVVGKTLAAAAVIGAGGSVGAEGPVIVAGAAVASRIGRFLRVSPNRLRTLVGCGAAAGLSAAFNAPIAGVIFGIEKILGTAGGVALGPFVVASVLATVVGRAIFGNHPVLAPPLQYGLRNPWELGLYALLGLAAGVVAVVYSRGVWRAQDVFDRLKPWQRILAGALIIGALDLLFRADLWGQGHESINLGVLAERPTQFLFALAAAKLVATAVTIAVAGAGGVFMPALFIGATLGGGLGALSAGFFSHAGLTPGAFAIAGMGALVAGATHAPLTAIMMVFEMTGDYGMMLPLMLTTMIAYAVARRLHPESIYTEWLVRRGVVLSHGADAAILARVPVAECLDLAPVTIPEGAGLDAILARTRESRQTDFPVVSNDGRLRGMLSRDAIREAVAQGDGLSALLIAADLASPKFDCVTPDDSLLTALRRLGARDVACLPVVATGDPDRLEGMVSRQDVLAAYEKRLVSESH